MGPLVGVPRETKSGEHRVSVTPEGAEALVRAGARVVVQAGAGTGSGFSDGEYLRAGASIEADPARVFAADLVVKVKEPLPPEYRYLSDRSVLFTYLHLAAVPELAEELLRRSVTAIAYETVTAEGGLPLLRPMSEVAGILSVQAGARGLEKESGGMGVLLSAVSGGEPSRVCVIGAGTAGRSAARVAAGIGAKVSILDISPEKLERVRRELGGSAVPIRSTPEALEREAVRSELVISTVLVVGQRAPVLISRELLRKMKRGAVLVDISIDQGGSAETSRPTTHADPFFVEEGIVHYCVANMPAAVPRTSTIALSRATLPYVERMVRLGVREALRADPGLLAGLNTYRGQVTCEGVGRALGKEYVPGFNIL
ncbi:MAG: alanine dehydrogenase [Deltaproteobacteria bacterium]